MSVQKRLNKAIQAFGADKVSVEWKPYQLDASFSSQPQAIEVFGERKFGKGWKKLLERLQTEGGKDGATFEDWKWKCNTMKSLQLVEFAKERGVDTSKSKAALFSAMYEKGEDVSDVDVLVKIALEQLGLDKSEGTFVREYLENDEGATVVKQQIKEGVQKYGIRGVPYFAVQGENKSERPFGISGAHPPETFLEMFDELSCGE
eukprot:CAMPEP_0116559938 /NCGR_PEP_ID=MMETSP0397-20121206/10689_1 /TAXON_ID=216820 /ORGANISM="Cyclophora tenuis, Strain ECT3854" /LENGTH=203 /DNA_ID=CAMNT_0004085793 /DNA_START=60 /DNA_END=670 /DNA_ORIENTATION=+